jgi:hypothetical protein
VKTKDQNNIVLLFAFAICQQIGNDLHCNPNSSWHRRGGGGRVLFQSVKMMILSGRSFLESISVISFVLTGLPNGKCESENRINNYEG